MPAANNSIKPALKIDWPNGENLNRKILGHFRPKQENFSTLSGAEKQAAIKQQPITNYFGKARDLFSGDLLKYSH